MKRVSYFLKGILAVEIPMLVRGDNDAKPAANVYGVEVSRETLVTPN